MNEYLLICVTILFAVGISFVIVGLPLLISSDDPVTKGVAKCVQLYHDTRSDKLYDECFDVLQENLK